jgi:hypothetical protein
LYAMTVYSRDQLSSEIADIAVRSLKKRLMTLWLQIFVKKRQAVVQCIKDNQGGIIDRLRRQYMIETVEGGRRIRLKKRRNRKHVKSGDCCWESTWGKMLILNRDLISDPTTREGKLFRRRFRVPFLVYCRLVYLSEENRYFECNESDSAGHAAVPIEMKVLGCLRALGRGSCFDDIAEASGMSEECARVSFHKFCKNFSDNQYSTWVKPPQGERLDSIMHVYQRMGLVGCIGSMDCVHVKWNKCPVSLTNLCEGKEGYPTLVFEVVVSHSREILSCTKSFYGASNDKTIVKYDSFVTQVRDKSLYGNIHYEVNGVDINQVYIITDGGYHKWFCLQSPISTTSDLNESRWSEWVESVRKDVECCFGILKQRWRFFLKGIELHFQPQIEAAFFTCCILHNMLLDWDDLINPWEKNVDWKRLHPQGLKNNRDLGYDDDGEETDNSQEMIWNRVMNFRNRHRRGNNNNNAVIVGVNNITEVEQDVQHFFLRSLLVEHFAKAYERGEISWPNKAGDWRKRVLRRRS